MSDRVLIHVLASGEWSGPERYAYDICRYYKDTGWNVRVVTRDVRIIDSRFKGAGIPVIHSPLRNYPDYYSARVLARLFKDMPRNKGIIHVHRYNDALSALMAKRLSRREDIRVVMTRHTASPGSNGLWHRFIYRGLDYHLFVSEYSKRRFYETWADRKAPLAEDKTAITFNSLYPLNESREEVAERVPKAIAYRGGLKPGKGIETLIVALGMVKDLKLRLKMVGRGEPDYVDTLRRLAHKEGVSEQIDWVRDSEFPYRLLRSCLFGVFPSAIPEAFGMANLELMALGKPQITTFEGAQSEFLIPGVSAVRIEPDDARGLAEEIRKLAIDSQLCERMGKEALDSYRKNFSWPKFLERLKAAYTPDYGK